MLETVLGKQPCLCRLARLHSSHKQACLLQTCCATSGGRRRGGPAGVQALPLRSRACVTRKTHGTQLVVEHLVRALRKAAMGTPCAAQQLPGLQRAPGKGRTWLLALRQRRWRCTETGSAHAATQECLCVCCTCTMRHRPLIQPCLGPCRASGQALCSALPRLLLCDRFFFCTCLFVGKIAASLGYSC